MSIEITRRIWPQSVGILEAFSELRREASAAGSSHWVVGRRWGHQGGANQCRGASYYHLEGIKINIINKQKLKNKS